MAPKRKLTQETNSPSSSGAADATRRVTRSSARLATATGRVTRSSTLATRSPSRPTTAKNPPKRKKAKKRKTNSSASAAEKSPPPQPPAEQESNVAGGSKTIIIEHCKQCNSFKTRAIQVKNGLEKDVEGVNILVNPEKPRRGCFEIREEDGEIFVSLLDMKRPFEPMKELDMEKVISDIVEKIK